MFVELGLMGLCAVWCVCVCVYARAGVRVCVSYGEATCLADLGLVFAKEQLCVQVGLEILLELVPSLVV